MYKLITWCMYTVIDENRKMGMVFGGGKQEEVRFARGGNSESCFETLLSGIPLCGLQYG